MTPLRRRMLEDMQVRICRRIIRTAFRKIRPQPSVEDAPAGHAETSYDFISHEIDVRFRVERRLEPGRWLGMVPMRRAVSTPLMTLEDFESQLATLEGVGPPDYADDGMLQYLKTERIIPPYQTRGYKVVELVRIYQLEP